MLTNARSGPGSSAPDSAIENPTPNWIINSHIFLFSR